MKNKPEGYAHLTAKIDRLKSELAKAQAEIVRLKAKAHAELAEATAEIERLKELLEHATDTVENNEQTDNEQMQLSPAEQRAAGQPHCPLCYTFGDFHRKGCKYANDGMGNHIRIKG